MKNYYERWSDILRSLQACGTTEESKEDFFEDITQRAGKLIKAFAADGLIDLPEMKRVGFDKINKSPLSTAEKLSVIWFACIGEMSRTFEDSPKNVVQPLDNRSLIWQIEKSIEVTRWLMESCKPDTKKKNRTRETLDMRALAVAVEHPSWSKRQIAEHLRCNEKSLAPKRCPKLANQLRREKSPDFGRVPLGTKKADGSIEAVDEW
ncbi:MAG: hypothetical protein O3A29_03605 [Planctomycetota bacterium]|nr:hypothetical protein [Planctomycetota bacterium]